MLKHTLLIDGEFGFDSTLSSVEGSTVYVGKISIRKATQLTFVCDSTPDSYEDAYQEAMKELELELEQQLMEADAEKMREHRQTGLAPGWLRLTMVRRWSNEVEDQNNV